jgi:hypothetical protein
MHGRRRVTMRRGATPFSSTPLWREKCAGCERVSRWDISGYLGSWRFNVAGEPPDVLAYDPGAIRVYVAAESGVDRSARPTGSGRRPAARNTHHRRHFRRHLPRHPRGSRQTSSHPPRAVLRAVAALCPDREPARCHRSGVRDGDAARTFANAQVSTPSYVVYFRTQSDEIVVEANRAARRSAGSASAPIQIGGCGFWCR